LGLHWKAIKPTKKSTTAIECQKISDPSLEVNSLISPEIAKFERPTVGLTAANLTADVFKDVVEIYSNWVGGNGKDLLRYGYFDSFRMGSPRPYNNEHRLGSWAGENSKLMIQPFFRSTNPPTRDVNYFEYYANGPWNKKFAERLNMQFNYQIDRFLRSKGIAVDLEWE
jgi:hypothetical protein